MLRALILGLTVLISACAITGEVFKPAPQPPQGSALVYFMRYGVGQGSAWPTAFYVDGKKIASVFNNGYSWSYVASGMHEFSSENPVFGTDHLAFKMSVQAGKEYYVEHTHIFPPGTPGLFVIRSVPTEDGKSIIKKFLYTPQK